jgi:hypothetical protein
MASMVKTTCGFFLFSLSALNSDFLIASAEIAKLGLLKQENQWLINLWFLKKFINPS